MADRRYVIEVDARNSNSGRKNFAGKSASSKRSPGQTAKKGGTEEQDGKSSIKKGFAKALGAVATAKGIADYAVGRVYTEQGNTDAAEKYSFWSSLAGQGIGIAAASLVGPVAVVAAAGAIGYSWLKKSINMQYDQYVEGVTLGQARLRAGPSLNRSR